MIAKRTEKHHRTLIGCMIRSAGGFRYDADHEKQQRRVAALLKDHSGFPDALWAQKIRLGYTAHARRTGLLFGEPLIGVCPALQPNLFCFL